MDQYNKYLKYIVLIICIFAVGFIILMFLGESSEKKPEALPENASFIENTSQEVPNTYEEIYSARYSEIKNLSLTSKPAFEVGEKYVYAIKFPPPIKPNPNQKTGLFVDWVYFNMTFNVDKKERINSTDYFLISTPGSGEVMRVHIITIDDKGNKRMKPVYGVLVEPSSVYINAENGSIISDENGTASWVLLAMFQPWMLKLRENLKFVTKRESKGIVTKPSLNVSYIQHEVYEIEYVVKGIEEVNGRKCYLIELDEKACTNENCKIEKGKKKYWVDVNKRIIVKYELWYEGLVVESSELKDYEK